MNNPAIPSIRGRVFKFENVSVHVELQLKAAPTLRTPFEFSIDSKRGAQNMAGVQFSRPSDHSQLKKSAQKTRADELAFSLRGIFWNPAQSQVKVGTRTLQNRSYTVIFMHQLRWITTWKTRPQNFGGQFSQSKLTAEPRKLNPNHTLSSSFKIHRELRRRSKRGCCFQLYRLLVIFISFLSTHFCSSKLEKKLVLLYKLHPTEPLFF